MPSWPKGGQEQLAKAKVQVALAIDKQGDLGRGRDRRAFTQHQMEVDLEPWTAA